MKLKLWNIILIFTLLFGCQNEQKLNGFYSVCNNGEYTEVYFKRNSMRVASEIEGRKLSEWRKIEIKKDTIYFESFDEWKHNWKVKIISIGTNEAELHNLNTDVKLNLERINGNLNFENHNEFWNGFSHRQKSRNCE